MGFKARTYKLVFEDPEFAGLEVRMRGLSLDRLVQISRVLQGENLVDQADDSGRTELFGLLADGLIGWNLEDEDGTPVPTDVAAIRAQPLDLVMQVVGAWRRAVTEVSAPLEPSLNGGPPSLEVSLPMEVLSPSPGS
jgi:hypothetical protein